MVAEDRRALGAALGHHGFHHRHHFLGDRRAQHALGFFVLPLDEGRRHQLAAVAERAVGARDLQRRHRQAVAVGHGGLGRAAPASRRRQHAGRFAGEAAVRGAAVAVAVDLVVEGLVRQLGADLGRADVGTAGDHPGHGQHAVVARHVLDGEATDRHVARVGVDQRVLGHHPGLQRGGDGQRLHRRTRLDQVGDRAVAARIGIDPGDRVRVVGRQVDHGHDLAGGHVHHHDRTAGSVVLRQRVAQFLVGQELDAAIDAEGQVLARLGRLDQVDALHDRALAVADHALGAGLAAQPFVVRQLQPFLAAVVDVGEAEHVRHRFALRVEAAELALREHARDAQRDHRMRLVRIDPALEVHELLVRLLRQLGGQFVAGQFQRLRQLRNAVGIAQQLLRIDPDRLHRRGHRQRLAVAVGDHAARGGDRQLAQVARLALALVEIAVDDLHVGGAADQGDRAQAQRRTDQHQPATEIEVAARAIAAGLAHGRTTTMSPVSGNFMPSRSRET